MRKQAPLTLILLLTFILVISYPHQAYSKTDIILRLFYEQNIGLNSYGKNTTFYSPYFRKYGIQINNLFAGFGCEETYKKVEQFGKEYNIRNIYQSAFAGVNYKLNKSFALSGIVGIDLFSDNDQSYRFFSNGDFININSNLNLSIRAHYELKNATSIILGFQFNSNSWENKPMKGSYIGLNISSKSIWNLASSIKSDSLKKFYENKLNGKFAIYIGTSTQKFGTFQYNTNYTTDKLVYDTQEYINYATSAKEYPKQINMFSFGIVSKRNNMLSFSFAKRDYFDADYDYNPNIYYNSFIYNSHEKYYRLNYNFNLLTFFNKYCYSPVYPMIDFSIFRNQKNLDVTNKYIVYKYDNNGGASGVGRNNIEIKMKSNTYLIQANAGFGFRYKHVYANAYVNLLSRNYVSGTVDRTINTFEYTRNLGSDKKIGTYNLPQIKVKGRADDYKLEDARPYALTFGFVF